MEKIKEWLRDNGSGYGDGSGYGLKSINNNKIYVIDGVQTIITNVKLNLAKGYIVKSDLTLDPCYVVKGDGYFAHGKTPKEANDALRAKIYENMDEDEAIEKFMGTFREDASYAGRDFFEWHHYLTGSCLMGRESFVKDKGLSLDAMYTVREFIELCKHAYGGEVIGHLKEKWEEKYDEVQNS